MDPSVVVEGKHVTRLEHAGRQIFLVGTAHVSLKSVEEVRRVIREVSPDSVCVELDRTRYEALTDDNRWRKLDIFQVLREKKVLFLLASLALSAYQRRIGEKLGVRPGAELLAAIEEARGIGAQVVLADRDIQATLKRSFHSLKPWHKLELIVALIAGFLSSQQITEEQVEQLKDRDTINELMAEFARAMPSLQLPLIDERDRYLMSSIAEAPGHKIVAIVGAGHISGMIRHLGTAVDRDALSELPQPSLAARACAWLIPLLVLGAFYFGYRQHQAAGLSEMAYRWFLPTSTLSALFSVFAGARLLTVLSAFLSAPLTTLNPTISAGMVAGLVEAWLRRPRVQDCEQIRDAILSVRGVYRNRFTRVLLVGLGASVGAALGSYVGAAWIAELLL